MKKKYTYYLLHIIIFLLVGTLGACSLFNDTLSINIKFDSRYSAESLNTTTTPFSMCSYNVNNGDEITVYIKGNGFKSEKYTQTISDGEVQNLKIITTWFFGNSSELNLELHIEGIDGSYTFTNISTSQNITNSISQSIVQALSIKKASSASRITNNTRYVLKLLPPTADADTESCSPTFLIQELS